MTRPEPPRSRVAIVIPALNEEEAIGKVIADIPDTHADLVIVVDNGSTDRTAETARTAGAIVVREPAKGYGRACKAGIRRALEYQADVIAFIDGDYADYPEDLISVLDPILENESDFVVGSRMRGGAERRAMLPQQWIGNALAGWVLTKVWKVPFTDMGPLRAISVPALRALGTLDDTYGWTLEMQVKAAEAGLRCCEVSVRYRPRIGVSKVTGTVSGTLGASTRILWLMARFAFTRGQRSYPNVPGT